MSGRYGKAATLGSWGPAGTWLAGPLTQARRHLTSPSGLAIGIGLLAALALFHYVIGLSLVGADAPYWRRPYGDMNAMLAGAEAVLRAPWTFPLTATRDLTAPDLTAAVYTDSIPWLLVALKALGLGGTVNLLGLFLLLSYLLQPVGGVLLARAAGARRTTTLVLAALLALLTPAWLTRQFGHISLTGQWLILFALALSLSCARDGLTVRRVLLFCLLGSLAIGIHAYHLVPVTAAFAAALIAEVTQGRTGAVRRSLYALVRFALTVGVSAFVLGYGVGQGASGGAGALGFYGMNLLAPFWPQASRLAGQTWNGQWFTGVLDPTGGQAFEGFNYLGAGALLLSGAAAITAAMAPRRPLGRGWPPLARRYGPLALAMIGLAALAVGPKGYLGAVAVFDIPAPGGRIGDALGLLRAHGRFFWAPAYLTIALALTLIDRALRPARLVALGLLVVGLQLADVSGLIQAVRQRYDNPWPAYYPPALATTALAGRPWLLFPRYYCTDNPKDQVTVSQLALLEVRQGGTSNTVNTARRPQGACDLPADLRVDATPQDPRITVMIDRHGGASPRFAALAGRGDCRRFNAMVACGRGVPDALSPSHPSRVAAELQEPFEIRFDTGRISPELRKGWSAQEPQFVWSAATFARIDVLAPMYAPQGLRVEVEALGFKPKDKPGQLVVVMYNGARVGLWQVGPAWERHWVDIPAGLVQPGQPMPIAFEFPYAVPVSEIAPGSPDERSLAMAIKVLRVSPLPRAPRGR